MPKLQLRNTRNMKKQGRVGPTEDHNSLASRSKNTEIPDKEFKNLALKMSVDFKENPNKQMDEVKKSVQDLDKKLGSIDGKYSREAELLKQ